MTNLVWGTIILSFFTLSWALLAAYVGVTAFLTTSFRYPRRGVFIFTSAAILIPTFIFLGDPDSINWLDRYNVYNFDSDTGRVFWTGRFVLNGSFFSGMVLLMTTKLTDNLESAFQRTWCKLSPSACFAGINKRTEWAILAASPEKIRASDLPVGLGFFSFLHGGRRRNIHADPFCSCGRFRGITPCLHRSVFCRLRCRLLAA